MNEVKSVYVNCVCYVQYLEVGSTDRFWIGLKLHVPLGTILYIPF